MGDRHLHGTFGDADQFCKYGVTHRNILPAKTVRLTIELQVHEEGGSGAAVGDEITHKSIENVWIDFHRYSSAYYSGDCSHLRRTRCVHASALACWTA